MAKRGENIYHRKDGRWEGRYIVGRKADGKARFRSIYGPSYSAVKRRLVELKAGRGQAGAAVLLYGDGSLSDWMDYWLEVLEKPYIKPTTYQLYRRTIETHLRPLLGECALRRLDSAQVQRAVDRMKERLAASTLHGVFRQLKSILGQAEKLRLLDRSPCAQVRLPRARQPRPRVLTTGEQARLERAALETGGLEYLVCLYAGVRLGELCALRYQDVGAARGVLCVAHSVKRVPAPMGARASRLIVGEPKTESSAREIPLPAFLVRLLKERMRRTRAGAGDFIFAGRQGGAGEPRTVQARFARLTARLGIRGAHMHTLRHTFAMRCLERGMGYKALSEILEHSSSQMTIRHYDNCIWESKARAMRAARLIA